MQAKLLLPKTQAAAILQGAPLLVSHHQVHRGNPNYTQVCLNLVNEDDLKQLMNVMYLKGKHDADSMQLALAIG